MGGIHFLTYIYIYILFIYLLLLLLLYIHIIIYTYYYCLSIPFLKHGNLVSSEFWISSTTKTWESDFTHPIGFQASPSIIHHLNMSFTKGWNDGWWWLELWMMNGGQFFLNMSFTNHSWYSSFIIHHPHISPAKKIFGWMTSITIIHPARFQASTTIDATIESPSFNHHHHQWMYRILSP